MKSINKTFYVIALAAAASMLSCSKEVVKDATSTSGLKKMKVGIVADIETKTLMHPGDNRISWKEGDMFDLFSDMQVGLECTLTAPKDREEAIMAEISEGATKVYAVYPSKEGNTRSSASISIPEKQYLSKAGNLNGNYCPMVSSGVVEAGYAQIAFKPVGGILALNLYNTAGAGENVKKVVVRPLKSDGTIEEKYCGSVTVDLTAPIEFNPSTESLNGVSVGITAPVVLTDVKPANAEETRSYANQVYVNLARKNYARLRIEVYTDDDVVILTTPASGSSYDLVQNDIIYQNVNLGNANAQRIKIDENDNYYLYMTSSVDIAGDKISWGEYGDPDMYATKNLNYKYFGTAEKIMFIDNADEANSSWSYASILPVAPGKIVIGRYADKKQATIKFADTKMLRLGGTVGGDVWIKNIRVETNSATYGVLQGAQPDGGASGIDGLYNWKFDACTFINSAAGLYRYNLASYSVPKSIVLENCIIRCNGPLFGVGKNATAKDLPNIKKLEKIKMNDCVVAPFSASATVPRLEANGIVVNLGNNSDNTYNTDNLVVEITKSSFYDMGAANANRGLIDVQTIGTVYMKYDVFMHSSGIKSYAAYANQACTASGKMDLSASYTNNTALQSGGNKGNLAPEGSGRSWNATVSAANQTFLMDEIDALNDYFPVEVISGGKTMTGGASYTTKPWVKVNAQ